MDRVEKGLIGARQNHRPLRPIMPFRLNCPDDLDAAAQSPRRVLIADDDHSVHEATVTALAGLRIHDRQLSFVHAYSAGETLSLLAVDSPVHLLLLDVIMESPDAGLRAVNDIRDTLGLRDLKIVIRTGQPGQRPEHEIRCGYANDAYANKAEMTRGMLRDVIAAALQPRLQDNTGVH